MASVASRLSVLSHFMEAVGVSDFLGCNGLLEFLFGLQWPLEVSHSEVNSLRLMT